MCCFNLIIKNEKNNKNGVFHGFRLKKFHKSGKQMNHGSDHAPFFHNDAMRNNG
jgi:hypothetical protein